MENLADQIIALIFERKYEQATAMIEAARATLSADESHRLTALAAVLQKEAGNVHRGIELIRAASQGAPTWLPHLYRLSVFLMDAQQWSNANVALDELISASERQDDPYFLDEARIRKILCLKALNRHDEIDAQISKIPKDVVVFVGDKEYRSEDLNEN